MIDPIPWKPVNKELGTILAASVAGINLAIHYHPTSGWELSSWVIEIGPRSTRDSKFESLDDAKAAAIEIGREEAVYRYEDAVLELGAAKAALCEWNAKAKGKAS